MMCHIKLIATCERVHQVRIIGSEGRYKRYASLQNRNAFCSGMLWSGLRETDDTIQMDRIMDPMIQNRHEPVTDTISRSSGRDNQSVRTRTQRTPNTFATRLCD